MFEPITHYGVCGFVRQTGIKRVNLLHSRGRSCKETFKQICCQSTDKDTIGSLCVRSQAPVGRQVVLHALQSPAHQPPRRYCAKKRSRMTDVTKDETLIF